MPARVICCIPDVALKLVMFVPETWLIVLLQVKLPKIILPLLAKEPANPVVKTKSLTEVLIVAPGNVAILPACPAVVVKLSALDSVAPAVEPKDTVLVIPVAILPDKTIEDVPV